MMSMDKGKVILPTMVTASPMMGGRLILRRKNRNPITQAITPMLRKIFRQLLDSRLSGLPRCSRATPYVQMKTLKINV